LPWDGYQVELVTVGPIGLWNSQAKDFAIASGTVFTVDVLPTLFVEGLSEGSGEIVARLLNPSGAPISQMTWVLVVVKLEIHHNGAALGVGQQTVWAGEHVDLRVVGTGFLDTVSWAGLNDAIKDYSITNNEGNVIPLLANDLDDKNVNFYWVQGGQELVVAVITRIDANFAPKVTGRLVRFDVKAPDATLEAITSTTSIQPNDEFSKLIYFGTNHTTPGVTITASAKPPLVGKWVWIQLIDMTFHRKNLSSVPSHASVYGLDQAVPYPFSTDGTLGDNGVAKDSPLLKAEVGNSYYDGAVDGTMWLMFQSNKANSIPVPISKIGWNWNFVVDHVGTSFANTWNIRESSDNAGNSQIALGDFPEWTTLVTSQTPLTWEPGE
jgi:hypothetical protein